MGIEDPYLWMEKPEDPRVVSWALGEDEAARSSLREMSEKLLGRIREYMEIPYIYAIKTSEIGYFVLLRDGKSMKLRLMRRDGEVSDLVESGEIADDAVITDFYVNREGRLLAYSYSIGGSDEGTLRIVDVEGSELVDELEGIVGDIVWVDRDKYYYVRFFNREPTPDGVDPPAERVFLRCGGEEEMVFGEGLPTSYLIELHESSGGNRALLKVSYGWSRSTVFGGPKDSPEDWRKIYGGGEFVVKPVDYLDGAYLVISYEGKGLGRVLAVDGSKARVIVEEQRYPLQEAASIGDRLMAHYLVNASSKISLFKLDGKKLKDLEFHPPGRITSIYSTGSGVVFKYESFTVPYRLYSLDQEDLKMLSCQELEENYEIVEEWAESKDGTRIHMFLVKRREINCDKALIYGYGGFAASLTPDFRPYIVPFLEDEGTYVVANTRGGGEYGEEWHRAGMREKKQNVFDDFKAVIKLLKERGAKVVAMGVSNGGLLVAAVLTQEPGLMDGAVIGYPVLDMLRFHKLYIGRAWVPEYGNPDDPEDRRYLAEYSPYHNIRRTPYPPVLVYTGLSDDRVHPSHAFKFAARLRDAGARVLLRVERASGHSGASPLRKLREYADIMAFVYKVLGMDP